MPLGTEVGLGPGDIVLDGDLAAPHLPKRDTAAPTFWPMYDRSATIYVYYGRTVAHLSNCRGLVLFVCEISREPLNGFTPNSHGRRVQSLARTSLKVKVRGQRSRSPGTKTVFFGHFGGLRAVCVW